jgi:solute carrier family 25 S-adenosylmethionine transporter 26
VYVFKSCSISFGTDLPKAGAFFTTYEAVKSLLTKTNPTLSGSSSPLIPQPFIYSAASATGELVSCLILTPAEVLKQNAQMIRKPDGVSASKVSTVFQPSVTIQALKHFKTPSQLWRGYFALAARNLPFTAMQFPMFEHVKVSVKDYRKKSGTFSGSLTETALTTAISAGSAGSVAAVITTPVDVVKTRIMLSAAGKSSEDQAKKEVEKARRQEQSMQKLASQKGVSKKSSFTVAREVIAESGIKGLFRGGALRAAWTALGSGLYLGVYESGRVFLGDRHESQVSPVKSSTTSE